MARGRMISQSITLDKDINKLSCDTSRLAYTWLITFADVEGRTHGDPAVLRSLLFPRREDITIEQMEGYIREWAELGLIVWYEAKGDMWIYFPAFTNHNKVDKNREAVSRIPAPTHDQLASNVRGNRDQITIKLNESNNNSIESNINSNLGGNDEIFKIFTDNVCFLTPMLADQLGSAIDEYGPTWVKDAIKVAVDNNARNMKYIDTVLRNRKNGKTPGKSGKVNNRRDTSEERQKYGEWETK